MLLAGPWLIPPKAAAASSILRDTLFLGNNDKELFVATNERYFRYVIVGGGLAGASAVAGIREIDKNSPVLLMCSEPHFPYHRPPLSKGLWLGKKSVDDIYVNPAGYYEANGVTLISGHPAERVDARNKTVSCGNGLIYSYDSLLIATGGTPRTFSGGQAGVSYFRYLDDYTSLRKELVPGKSALVIGGGFIGSEMAAALSACGIKVTMLFPEKYPCASVFPESLGKAVLDRFVRAGVSVFSEDKPRGFDLSGRHGASVGTEKGETLAADCIIAGIGIRPSIEIAEKAGLLCDNGIVVNERLQTSDPNIFAAGDVARFPYHALSSLVRLEHWDNALAQGRLAGRNMAGAHDAYTYMPYFFSDIFEYGYEAVGEINPALDTIEDWRKDREKGVVYYLKNDRCVGVLLFNVWEKVDAARELIKAGPAQPVAALRGAIQ
jgi:3-phenylpropionate/trans-cinnamate dioxygenase ferredoxin reductase component